MCTYNKSNILYINRLFIYHSNIIYAKVNIYFMKLAYSKFLFHLISFVFSFFFTSEQSFLLALGENTKIKKSLVFNYYLHTNYKLYAKYDKTFF